MACGSCSAVYCLQPASVCDARVLPQYSDPNAGDMLCAEAVLSAPLLGRALAASGGGHGVMVT